MYPPHHLGGYELSCRDVVDRLRARGHDVTVLTTSMRLPGVDETMGERERGIWRDLDFYFRDADVWAPSPWRRLQIERHNQRVLRRTLDAVRPEVVSVWHMVAMSLGLLATLASTDIPLVYAVCDDWLIYGTELDRWMAMFRRRRARPLARVVAALTRLPTRVPDLGRTGSFLFVSDSTRRAAESWSPWSYPDSTVVYSGVDPRDFPPGAPPAGDWQWRLLYVGRIEARKGLHTLVRALALLPDDATLTVVGRGNDGERAAFESVVADAGVAGRVTVDAVDRAALRDRYLAADVVVFPSEWAEPFGLVPVEAMACSRPVVATGVGGSDAFLVDGANCVRFTPGDPNALAAAVHRLAGDPELRDRVVAGGRHTARELDVDRLADTFEAWHDAAAARFAHGRPPDRMPPVPPGAG
jgi:glycosyltransferase involved in cell wall biosynthesis